MGAGTRAALAPPRFTRARCPFALASSLVALALLLLAAPAAQAAPTTIASFGKGAGKVSHPESVAVDQSSGDLYVADFNNHRVDKFDAEGDFLLAWGGAVADGKSGQLQTCGPDANPPTQRCFTALSGGSPGEFSSLEAVAVDQSSHDVYVTDRNEHRVTKFTPSGAFVYMVGKNVDKTKAKEEGPGAPYTQGEKDICTAADLAAGDTCGQGEAGTGPGEFTRPVPLAIASSGRVWVGDTERLVALESDGSPGPEPEIVMPGAGNIASLAIDSAGAFYLKSQSLSGIRKLHPNGAPFGSPYPLDAGGKPVSVTVDGAGDVYVADATSPYRFMIFAPAGEQVSQFGTGQVIGHPERNALVVDDKAKTLYVASAAGAEAESAVQAFPVPEPGPLPEGQHAKNVLPTTATLAATLNPEGHETEYRFEYGLSESYGQETPVETLPVSGFEDKEVQAGLEGLIPSTTYHFRLCATNSAGSNCGPDTTFVTRSAIAIEAQWATDVAAHSATVRAELDPLGVKGEWWVQYGEGESFDRETERTPLATGFGAVPVSVPLAGLDPSTNYSYRFLAEDEREGHAYVVEGEPLAFATQPAGLGFALPDERAWEMVSPSNKHGGRILAPEGSEGGQVQAAADGEALAYLSNGSLEANPEGNRLIEMSSQLARRGPGGRWSTVDITPPHAEAAPYTLGEGAEYKLFSPNLERALLLPRDATPLAPWASERTPYLRADATTPPAYTPLLVGCPPEGESCPPAVQEHANVPAGTEFGKLSPEAPISDLFYGNVRVQGASPDLSHVVVSSKVPLAAGDAGESLYEWAGGAIAPLSVQPGKAVAVQAELGSGSGSVRGAISEDGSRVFWSAEAGEGNVAGLYVRDTARGETVRLDEVQPGGFGTGKASPLFQGANAEGTVAFFTDTQNLTEDANEEGADLYRCEVVVEGGSLRCDLSDLTSSSHLAFGEFAEVRGLMPGISEDGSRAYFVARGVLASNQVENGTGPEDAQPGQPNLYLWQEGEGVRFVATLGGEDANDWGILKNGTESQASQLSAAASSSGRYLALMSDLPLTGYDNRDASSGEPAQEVFRYDAEAERLTCVSCNPSGARPRALYPGLEAGQLSEEFDPDQLWGGRAVAAVLPEAIEFNYDGISAYRPRAVQDDGRVFFNAADPLVPADSNGDGDVYEYEPTGTGSCSPSSSGAGTALIPGACVSLISSGTSVGTAAFLDASEGSSDVFFYSPAQLSATDEDEELDVYDARVDGEPAKLEPSAECLGEACQPPYTPPSDPTPASSSFEGAGNVHEETPAARCPKGKHETRRKGKIRCLKPSHKQSNHKRGRHDHRRTAR